MQQDIWPQIILGGVVAAVIAAIITGRITRSIKISEFRQKWIDELRKDIADYIGVAHEWIKTYEAVNPIVDQAEKARLVREKVEPVQRMAIVVLARIKLRFNPFKNRYQREDNEFLLSLGDLIDPGKLPEDNSEAEWHRLADQALQRGRNILKREWEVTKQPSQWF